jgi:hypothetical protein
VTARPKTLLIAPATDLAGADAEVQRIANALHPTLLINHVTLDSLLTALQPGAYQYIHFACHADLTGIRLSDGETISAPHLVQIIRSARPECVFLNTCSSLEIAMALHDANPDSTVIATILDIDDTDAYITGSIFAAEIARGKPYAAAYEASRPPVNRKYIMLNGSARLNSDTDADDQKRLMLQVWAEMQRRMDDSDALSLRSLDAMRQVSRDLTDLKAEVAGLKREITRYQRRPTRVQALLWSGGYAVFCLVIALAYQDIRERLDFSPIPTLIVSLMLLLGAFILFVLGLGFRFHQSPQ